MFQLMFWAWRPKPGGNQCGQDDLGNFVGRSRLGLSNSIKPSLLQAMLCVSRSATFWRCDFAPYQLLLHSLISLQIPTAHFKWLEQNSSKLRTATCLYTLDDESRATSPPRNSSAQCSAPSFIIILAGLGYVSLEADPDHSNQSSTHSKHLSAVRGWNIVWSVFHDGVVDAPLGSRMLLHGCCWFGFLPQFCPIRMTFKMLCFMSWSWSRLQI